jgi:tryptophan 7-halogenase
MTRINRVAIVGGGTAGWMAAAALSKTFGPQLQIDLVESDEIGTVGVGEATIPPIRNFHLLLELSEADFMRAVNGTFKLGIEFLNWGSLGERYFHPFSAHGTDTWAAQFHHYWVRARQQGETAPLDDFSLEAMMARADRFGQEGERKANYAYHFDAGLYARLLRGISERLGVRRTEGKVVDVRLHPETGFIESVLLDSGQSHPCRPVHRLQRLSRPAHRTGDADRLGRLGPLAAQQQRRRSADVLRVVAPAVHARHRPQLRLAVENPAAESRRQRPRVQQ